MKVSNRIHRLFLIADGLNNHYPNYPNARLKITRSDPAEEIKSSQQFLCSPIFSLKDSGVDSLPDIANSTVTFLVCPIIYPAFNDIITKVNFDNEIWFSLGLANLIIIEKNKSISEKVIDHLKDKLALTAYERLTIKNNAVIYEESEICKIIDSNYNGYHFEGRVSALLPLNLQFAVSEFILAVNKFLNASNKFTPQYFNNHLRTIQHAAFLVNDLCFLGGDKTFAPSNFLMQTLNAKDGAEVELKLLSNNSIVTKEELINDRHSRLVQFNSSLSYIYTQCYSGIFPLFDQNAIIGRYSLLGIGGAIGALYELLCQLEQALYHLPFEKISSTIYKTQKITSKEYFDFFNRPALLQAGLWSNDTVLGEVKKVSNEKKTVPQNYFNRLSFFSGRLGFREYDLSATAAVQVIIEAHSLEWNIINYTHEIIHNHVRIILNQITKIPSSSRNQGYNDWLKSQLDLVRRISINVDRNVLTDDVTYYDYIIVVIMKFCINSKYNGSLSRESNFELIQKLTATLDQTIDNVLPNAEELRVILNDRHKDITEIFVHVIDFCYIYNQNIDFYITSIWASWINVQSVTLDLKQYILRSILIISISIDGNSKNRFDRAKIKFQNLIEKILSNQTGILRKILEIIINPLELKDLKYRFYNCITICDLVYSFFIGELQTLLNNNDKNIGEESTNDEIYLIERCSFEGYPIKSKVRFALSQLVISINNRTQNLSDYNEKISAWLLISLSSVNYEDQI